MIYLGNLKPESNLSEFAKVKKNLRKMLDRGFITESEYENGISEWKAIVNERFRQHGYVRQG